MAEQERLSGEEEQQPSPEQNELDQEDIPYNGSMATALADQRISRKKAGEDVKILANRIALLKAEEQKAWKKIEETKKKAQDILEVRHRNITKNTSKNSFKNQQEYERQMQAENNRRIKDEREKNIMFNKMSVYDRA
jgi:alkanesulfonate monooxygenase SsuD/methylene tetrahydromethanopterin reductase-like flavin-dependent oxidoreductase (luciferase family)